MDQLVGARSVEGKVTYCADSLARRVQDCYRLYECRHVEYQDGFQLGTLAHPVHIELVCQSVAASQPLEMAAM